MNNSLLGQLSSPNITLHPVCFFSVAVQGEPREDDITYVKAKQLSAIDRDGDAPYYLLSNIYSYIRQLECDVQLAINENIVSSVMENAAWIELYMKLAKKAYENTKNNQPLYTYYKNSIQALLSEHKNVGKMAVELSEGLLHCTGNADLWAEWKTAQRAVQTRYEELLKQQGKL